MSYQDTITIDPNKRGGKPCVRGLRITVYEVLDYLASDMSEEELEDFPNLTPADLKACIAFAAEWERRLFTVKKQSLIAGYEQFAKDYAASEDMQRETKIWLDCGIKK